MDESTFESQYSLESDVFQASMIALHDSACSGQLNYGFSLPLSSPKVKRRMVLLTTDFDYKCEKTALLYINVLCHSTSK